MDSNIINTILILQQIIRFRIIFDYIVLILLQKLNTAIISSLNHINVNQDDERGLISTLTIQLGS
jgi:hypothetical protein